jgi:hypothetical protein
MIFVVYFLHHGVSLRVPDSRFIRTTPPLIRIIKVLLYSWFYWMIIDISTGILSSLIFVA